MIKKLEFDLTPRQLEVLDLLDEGLTLAEISKKLWIEQKTARVHAWRIRRALGARTTAQAMGIAYRRGILPVPAVAK